MPIDPLYGQKYDKPGAIVFLIRSLQNLKTHAIICIFTASELKTEPPITVFLKETQSAEKDYNFPLVRNQIDSKGKKGVLEKVHRYASKSAYKYACITLKEKKQLEAVLQEPRAFLWSERDPTLKTALDAFTKCNITLSREWIHHPSIKEVDDGDDQVDQPFDMAETNEQRISSISLSSEESPISVSPFEIENTMPSYFRFSRTPIFYSSNP